MRSRRFRFAGFDHAHEYVTHLLENGINFQVFCNVNWIDVQTPFELAPQDFPTAAHLKEIK